MSEYWKSTPKYWCKHCSTYVKDTPFERKQHENTGKHQGNLKRFLRGIQNDHEKTEREKEMAKAEVERLNRVVGGQSSGATTTATTSKLSSTRKSTTAALTAVDQKRQWAQLAEMGIQVPENFRAEMAMPGQWQTINAQEQISSTTENTSSMGVRKRKLSNDEVDEQAHQPGQLRGWGTTTRKYPGQDDLDLDAILCGSVMRKEQDTKPVLKSESLDLVSGNSHLRAGVRNEDDQSVEHVKLDAEVDTKTEQEYLDNYVDSKSGIAEINIQKESPGSSQKDDIPVFKRRKAKPKTA